MRILRIIWSASNIHVITAKIVSGCQQFSGGSVANYVSWQTRTLRQCGRNLKTAFGNVQYLDNFCAFQAVNRPGREHSASKLGKERLILRRPWNNNSTTGRFEDGKTTRQTQHVSIKRRNTGAQIVGSRPVLGSGDCGTGHRCQRNHQPSVRSIRPLGLDGGRRSDGIHTGHAGLPATVGLSLES